MIVPFKDLAPNSRLWIYTAKNAFDHTNIDDLSAKTETFLASWTSHQQDVKASYLIAYGQILIIAAEEGFAHVGGCSIDKLVHFIQDLNLSYNADLLNAFRFATISNENITVYDKPSFIMAIASDDINNVTHVLDHTIKTVSQLALDWKKPLKASWHFNFFKKHLLPIA